MRKKIIMSLCAGILSFCMLFSAPVGAAEYTDIGESEYAASIRLLSALGILTGQDEHTFAPENNITRAEFAAMLCRLCAGDGSSTAAGGFSDVPAGHWAEKEIGAVAQLRIMTGTDDGRFLPEENITLNEAVKTMVVMAGYEEFAAAGGGYPTGYLAVAENKKMLRKIRLSGNTPITRALAAKLLDNMLQIPALEVSEFGVKIAYNESSLHTNFYTFLGVEKGKGLVEATDHTTLNMPAGARKNTVMIDGVRYDAGETDAAQYLGMTVEFYYNYDETDLQVLRFVQPSEGKNETLTLDADSIVSYTGRLYHYEDDETGATNDAGLADDFRVVYNGRAWSGDFSEALMKPSEGDVRLVDYDGDGLYDTVFIEDYETLVVGGYDTDNQMVYDIEDPSKKISLRDSDSVTIKDASGNAFSPDKFAKNNVVSVMKNGEYTTLIVSQSQVSGALEQIEDENGTVRCQVGGKVHEALRSLPASELSKARLGDNVTLYLNHKDKIAHIRVNAGAYGVGFLAQKSMKNKEAADPNMQLRIFTTDGELKDFRARKIRWNGSGSKRDAAELYEEIPTYTMVEYRTDDKGEITDLAVPVEKEQATDGRLFIRSERNYHVFKNKARTFGGQENMMGDCVIFSVPDEQDVSETEEYQILSSTDLEDGKYYTYNAYGTQTERLTAQYILMVGQGGVDINGDTGFSVVSRVTRVLDKDGQDTYKLTLLNNNGETSVVAANPRLVTNNRTSPSGKNISIDPGDIIRYSLNGSGLAKEIELTYDLDTDTYIDRSDSARYDTKLRTMFGYVGDTEDTVYELVSLTSDEEGNTAAERMELCSADGAKILVYDTEAPKDRKLRSGSYTDLLSYRQAGMDCSKVFVHLRAADPRTIVIYK